MKLEELEKQLYECSLEIIRLKSNMDAFPSQREYWSDRLEAARIPFEKLESQHSVLLASGARHVVLDTTPIGTPSPDVIIYDEIDEELFSPKYTPKYMPSSCSVIEFMGGPMDGDHMDEDAIVLDNGLIVWILYGIKYGYMKSGDKLMFLEVV